MKRPSFRDSLSALIILMSLFFFSAIMSKAETDSLVNKNDLSFDLTMEKEYFFKEFTGKNMLELAYYTNNYKATTTEIAAFKQKVDRQVADLQATLPKIKKREKQIQQIYTSVHAGFLTKYETYVDFNALVSSGTYNCVTATLLYALILDRLSIPYSIKETPQHVYLVSYPEAEQILIESTDPAKGYMFFNDAYKSLFVQNLRKSKIVSEQEFRSIDTNTLFDKYYYADKNISLTDLIGIHYTNIAIFQMEKENYREVYNQMKKAYYLNNTPKNLSLLYTSARLVMDGNSYNTTQDISDLLFLCRFIDKGISAEEIQNEFLRITYLYIVNSNRHQEYDRIYARFDSAITDPYLRKEISFSYNYEKGRGALIKGQYAQGYPYVKNAFELKDENSDAQINLISNLSNLVSQATSRLKILPELDSLAANHPIIMENNNFIQLYKVCQLMCMEELYKANKPDEGGQIAKVFESLNESYTNVIVPDDSIGRAYSEAAVYYFKKGNKTRSKEFISKGLMMAPDSQELKTRKMMLN